MTAAVRICPIARGVQGVCSSRVAAVAKNTHGFHATLARTAALRYALAPVCIAVALLVQMSISGPVPVWSQSPPFIHATGLFQISIVAAAWFGGAGPGLLSAVLATLLLPHLIAMNYPLTAGFLDLPRLLAFAITGLAVGLGTTFRKRAEGELRTARNELEKKVLEQTAELRRSEALLARAQRLSQTGSFAWKVSKDELVWSEETFRIFQYDRTTKPTLEIILQRVHPEDAAKVKKTIDWATQDGKHFEHEYRLLMPDGSVKHVHVVTHAVRDESGGVEFVGAVMDVTEQHQARAALEKAFDEIRKSEERLRLTLDTIPNIVVSILPDGSIDFVNQRWVEYHGLTLEDLHREGLEAVYHPEDLAGYLDRRRASLTAGTPFEHEARQRRADGVYRWRLMHSTPLRDEVGNIVKWYGTSIDIEDRKQAEEALRESEQRFRDYAEIASDWLWETAPDHRFTRVSQRLDAHGDAPPSRIGLTRWDYATNVESDPEKWRLHRATLDAHQPFRDFVYSATREDGSTVYLRTSGKPFFDGNGYFLGYRGVAIDVTAAVRADQAEEALRNVQAELAHVTRVTTLGELAASIAHEVNQPLAAIVTNGAACLRWLARDVPDIDEVRGAVERMINDGNRAAEVIRRVRALSKKTDAMMAPLPVNEVIDEAILLLRHEVLSHRALLRVELASELPLVRGDRIQLQQVIINLAMNGMEAMAPVTGRARELKIRSRREADAVLVAVEDSGVGIEPAHVDQLFNAFFTTKPSGMGMGLSICRSIIEAHGGKLWTSRNVGAGATFQFTLPAYQEHAS